MDIGRLYEFVTLAECLNYSKAAQQLYITQPVLSRHIHDLEQHVGAQLLVRDTHSVELTPIGRLFVEEANKLIDDYEGALKKVSDTAHGTTGYLKIGFMTSAVEPFLRDFVLYFKKEQPSIQLDLEALDLDELLKDVNSNRFDIGFATHVSSSGPFNVRPILKDALCLAVSYENPLSQYDEIHIEQLDNVGLVCLSKEENPITYKFHEDMFERHNTKLNIIRTVPNMETALFFASLNEGVCLMPSHLEHMVHKKATKMVRVSDPDTNIILNLIWKKDNMNPGVPLFVDSFEEYAKKYTQQ